MYFSDEGTGQPVVLVHGFPLDQTMWAEQSALLGRLRLVRFDLPGFGGAPPLAGPPSMAAYADAVCDALDRARLPRAALCGLSLGGYILFELWRRCRERVSALVLCDTRAEGDTPAGQESRREGLRRMAAGRREELLADYLPKLLAPASLATPAIVERVRAMNHRAADAGIVAALQAMHDRPDSTSTLATIDVPTLIVVGSEDALTPPALARSMHDAIADSRLVEIPNAGHLTPIENPAAFNVALADFLAPA